MKFADQINEATEIFLNAVKDGNTLTFNALLDPLLKHKGITEIIDPKFGGNALHWAACHGRLEIVKVLIERFPKLVDSQSHNGSTPILDAIINDHFDIVKLLASKNTNLTLTNKNKLNAFAAAAQKEDNHPIKKYFQELHDLLNQNFTDAINNHQLELLPEWLDKGADIEVPIRKSDDSLIIYTALFHACATGDVDLVKLLINRQANINVVGAKNGFTPLHAAVFFGYSDIVKLLINADAKITKDVNGQTPLELAQTRNLQSMINLLQPETKQETQKTRSTNLKPFEELKHDVSSILPSSNATSMDELQKRINNLTKSAHVSNSVFGKTQSDLQQHSEKSKTTITLNKLREQVNSLSSQIDKIAKAGKESIEGYNAKCQTADMKFDYSEFQSYSKHVLKCIGILKNEFNKDSISDITQTITENYKLHNKVSDITGSTSNMYNLVHNTIIPSQEYGKAYSTLVGEMISLKQNANKLLKEITKIKDNKMEIESENTQFRFGATPC